MNRLLKFLADVAGHPVLGVKLNERKFPHSHLVALVAFAVHGALLAHDARKPSPYAPAR